MIFPRIFSHMEKFEHATPKISIETFKKAIKYTYQCRIKEKILFQMFLEENGKVEIFWLEYERSRWKFGNIHEFVN